MAKYQETKVEARGQKFLTFINQDGELVTIDNSHPGYENCLMALRDYDDVAYASFIAKPLNVVGEQLGNFDTDLRVHDGGVYYGDIRLPNLLAETVLGYVRNGREGAEALANFIVRLYNNPNQRSIDQLFEWVVRHGITLDSNGYIIAHKGVQKSGSGFHSVSAGHASVNGKEQSGRIYQSVGDVVSMERSKVDDNGDAGCSSGLHVGTLDYATRFAPWLLTVEIDPADVVSVPNDHDFTKMRVCRYTVIGINRDKVEFPKDSAYVGGESVTDNE